MSNIGKKIIFCPSSIQIHKNLNFIIIGDSNTSKKIKIKIINPLRILKNKDNLSLDLIFKDKFINMWGTYRSKLYKIIYGLYKSHTLKLKFIGVGFKANLKKDILILRLGFSHKFFCQIPKEVNLSKIKKRPPTFLFKSSNLNIIKRTAFLIRSFKKPEPYKGKGILFFNEFLKLKEGKKSKNN